MTSESAPGTRSRRGSAPLVATLTLGCKLNQAESQSMGRALVSAGCDVIDRPVVADAYLINTCTVTHVADRNARRLIRMAKRLAPEAPVVVTGCYADWASERIAAETGADLVLSNRDKGEAVAGVLARLGAARAVGEPSEPGQLHEGRTRAFLKIQEGCDDVCAFCIVPGVRGRERAVPIDAIVAEAQAMERAGAQEVVLTGKQPGAYGRDRDDGTNAAGLIEALLTRTTLPRIRYSSIQPQDVSASFLEQWQDERMCRHFHVALQSGSDAVLERMRRRYDVVTFLGALERIRAAVPGAAVTTDVIVGFPGEGEAEFAETVSVSEEAGFARMHLFPYSERPRTGAALMEDDVPNEVKRERMSRLQVVAEAGSVAFRAGLVGTVQAVLMEGRSRGKAADGWSGLTDTYVPVRIIEAGDWNRLLPVAVEGLDRLLPVAVEGLEGLEEEGVRGSVLRDRGAAPP